jgi:hypothetical protein
MRFYDTDPRPLHISELRAGLREIDPAFDIEGDSRDSGFLLYSGEVYADISIDSPDSNYFDYEADSLTAEAAAAKGPGKEHVEAVLRDAQRSIVASVRSGGRDCETNLSRMDVLWDWLFIHRSGLLHAEGEGFYDGELILAVK